MYYIGLMAGTGVDGIDSALVTLIDPGGLKLEATHRYPYPANIGNPRRPHRRPGPTPAAALAWLAKQALEGTPGNLPSVTGARHPVVLAGSIRPEIAAKLGC